MKRSRTANKRWKKVHARRLARRRGYRKMVVGYGGMVLAVLYAREAWGWELAAQEAV